MSRLNLDSGGMFIHKPARGWLHSDGLILKEGVTYTLRVSQINLITTYLSFIKCRCFFFAVCWLFGSEFVHEEFRF